MKWKSKLFVYTKDVQFLTGCSERSARYLVNKIRLMMNKEPWQPVTVSEFSVFMNVDEGEVRKHLGEKRG